MVAHHQYHHVAKASPYLFQNSVQGPKVKIWCLPFIRSHFWTIAHLKSSSPSFCILVEQKKLIIAAPKNHLRRIVASHIHQSCDGSCFWIYLRRSSGPRVVVDAPVKQSYVMSYSWSPGIRGAEFPEALNRNELYQWLAWWTECIPSDSNAFEGCCFWLWQDFLDGHLRFRYENSRNTPGLFAGIGSKEAGTKVDKSQSCSADHRDQLMNLFGRPPCYNLVTQKRSRKDFGSISSSANLQMQKKTW